MDIRFIDWFAGIGGFRLGLEKANQESREAALSKDNIQSDRCDKPDGEGEARGCNPHFRCVGSCEIDRYARRVYERNFGHEPEWADSTTVDVGLLPDFDLLCAGFPCQSFSVAGKRGGLTDIRGTLFFELCRILRAKRPAYFIFENVKGLLSVPYTELVEQWADEETGEDGSNGSHRPIPNTKGFVFFTILNALDELGYDCQWQVLNSKDFGVPQNRERVFLIGNIRGIARPQVFPLQEVYGKPNEEQREIQDNIVPKIGIERKVYLGGDAKVHLPDEQCQTLEAGTSGGGGTSNRPIIAMTAYTKGNRTESRIQKSDTYPCLDGSQAYAIGQKEAYPCLTPAREKRQQGRRFKDEGEPMFSLTGQDIHGVLEVASTVRAESHSTADVYPQQYRLRRLTPTECERLQGFPDNWTAMDSKGNPISDGQRYKMCGNAVTTNVIVAIGAKFLKVVEDVRS